MEKEDLKNIPPVKKVLVFGSGTGGHHLKYASIIIDGFFEKGHEVSFASGSQTFGSLEHDLLLRSRGDKFRAIGYKTGCTGRLSARIEKAWRLLVLLIRHKWDVVFIPYLDYVFYVFGPAGIIMRLAGWRFPDIYGVLMDCDFAYPEKKDIRSRKIKHRLFKSILESGPFKRVFLIDEIAYNYIREDLSTDRLSLCPDPVDSPEDIDMALERQKLGIPAKARVIGIFGILGEGKGVDYLVRAFLKRPPGQDEYLLLMGKQTPGLRSKLEGLIRNETDKRNIVIADRFVADSELLAGISSVDVVAVTYPGHLGSASFLIRAAAAGKPVLGSDTGWVGRIMARYRLGHSCNVTDETGLSAGLDWAFSDPQDDCRDAGVFASGHTIARFKDAVFNRISSS